jgi:hypothetical protein
MQFPHLESSWRLLPPVASGCLDARVVEQHMQRPTTRLEVISHTLDGAAAAATWIAAEAAVASAMRLQQQHHLGSHHGGAEKGLKCNNTNSQQAAWSTGLRYAERIQAASMIPINQCKL